MLVVHYLLCLPDGAQVAAAVGYLPVLNFLLDKVHDSGSLNAKSRGGMTPLMAAAAEGHAKAVAALLKHGADACITEKDKGWSALSHAAYHGHKDVCSILAEK